jgi:hypothetical protein
MLSTVTGYFNPNVFSSYDIEIIQTCKKLAL